MLLIWSLSSITFGIVRCDVCRVAEIAVAVMPGMFAMSSKRGAAGFGEPGDPASTA